MDEKIDLIREIQKIEISTGILVEGLQSGLYHSVFRGQGVEFTDIREYVPGDDIRSIDWKVTARSSRPFVKEFTEDRDQTFYLVLDISGSGNFGSELTRKRKITHVAASLAFGALRNNDRIGLCLFSDRVEKFIPARRGRKHLIALLGTIISHEPRSVNTDLGQALRFLGAVLKRRCSVIILSDFVSRPFLHELQVLRERHEVIAIRVKDPRERELPDIGLVELEDPETGEQLLVDTSDRNVRMQYRKIAEEVELSAGAGVASARVGEIPLLTTEPYDIPLIRFFQGLRKRGAAHGRIF
jgi:uncharacterized protein (DUF58 family)